MSPKKREIMKMLKLQMADKLIEAQAEILTLKKERQHISKALDHESALLDTARQRIEELERLGSGEVNMAQEPPHCPRCSATREAHEMAKEANQELNAKLTSALRDAVDAKREILHLQQAKQEALDEFSKELEISSRQREQVHLLRGIIVEMGGGR